MAGDAVAAGRQAELATGNTLEQLHESVLECTQRVDLNWESAEASSADVRGELVAMRAEAAAADKKLQVALRFIDWFADVKLKNRHCSYQLDE
jgi:hypothetical protein